MIIPINVFWYVIAVCAYAGGAAFWIFLADIQFTGDSQPVIKVANNTRWRNGEQLRKKRVVALLFIIGITWGAWLPIVAISCGIYGIYKKWTGVHISKKGFPRTR